MKVFVDLRGAPIAGVRFAWWDTVRDEFERHGGSMAWDRWEEFESDCMAPMDRYERLAPNWARR